MSVNKDQEITIENQEAEDLSKLQIWMYSLIIIGAITIMILSMIGADIIVVLIVIPAVLVYVYFREDLEDETDDSIIKKDRSEGNIEKDLPESNEKEINPKDFTLEKK